jgi:peptidoglycan/LPS O-acetylase OafA/YrhL
MKRIPTLDGWRGLAIALVLFDHIQHALLDGYMRPWTQTGQHGVTIFFVLSGFLITSKLIEGPINPKRFYLRRFFRLMPAAWVYLAFLLLVSKLIGKSFTTPSGVLACVFFYRNYVGTWAGGATGHFWSLSLEEQFYLVWPCILLLAGMRRSRWIAAAGAIACAAFRWVFWAHYDRNLLDNQSQVRADALLVGCLLAMLLADGRVRSLAVRCSRFWVLPACCALLFGIARFHWLPPLFESVSIALLIAATALHRASWFARPFSFAPLAWIGTVSYSVYLWQEFFTDFHSPWALGIAMPLFALASYYGIERPCTRLGHRLTSSKAPGSPVEEMSVAAVPDTNRRSLSADSLFPVEEK